MRCLVSVSDTLQLMVGFGTFVVMLIGLVVELIKNSNKK
ncbi:putative holin-like toxin [Leuconostoc pseudomesenteroides]|nr:putative holin-like toxin [Leuconostoc pseudomesenteroides]